jgi:CRP/FNR family transcriptional regulator
MPDREPSAILPGFLPFWAHLTSEQQASLVLSTACHHYPKGTNIHGGSNDCAGILLVIGGELRVYMLSEEGREVTLYRMAKGDVCVMSASCALRAITFEVRIDASEDCELCVIKPSVFDQVQRENIYAEAFAYRQVTERFSDVMWAMQQILFMSFDKRLAVFLLDEVSRTGGDTVRHTQEEIARYLGGARESVTRMLKYFQQEGLVSLSRGGVTVLNRKGLRALLN